MNYLEEYKDFIEDEKIVYDNVPPEIKKDAMRHKNAFLIFHEHIDMCRKKLGENPVVARMIYELVKYDRMVEKDKYEMPDFSNYENGEKAEIVFEVMIAAAETNFRNYITGTMQKRYNGSKNKKKEQEENGDFNLGKRWLNR